MSAVTTVSELKFVAAERLTLGLFEIEFREKIEELAYLERNNRRPRFMLYLFIELLEAGVLASAIMKHKRYYRATNNNPIS